MKPALLLYLIASVLFFSLEFTPNFEFAKSALLITMSCLSIGTIRWRDVKRDWIGRALILFCLSAALSTYFSIDRHMSIWGNWRSTNGLIVTISYAVLYFIAKREFKSTRARLAVTYSVIFAAFSASLYAVCQVAGHDPIQWSGVLSAMGFTRPPSTIGQPILLAGYLVMAIPFALYVMEFHTGLARIASGATLALSLVSVFFSQSRGAWVALIASLAFYCCLTGGLSRALKLCGASLIAFLVMLGVNSQGFRDSTFDRMRNIASPGPARLEYPKAAIRIWKKYPWLGCGTDAFETAFQKQRTDFYWKIEPRGSPHRAHNEFLNILATQGLIGVLALSFLSLCVFGAMRFPAMGLRLPIVTSIMAFYLQNLTSFTTIATGSLFIVCLAMLGPECET